MRFDCAKQDRETNLFSKPPIQVLQPIKKKKATKKEMEKEAYMMPTGAKKTVFKSKC